MPANPPSPAAWQHTFRDSCWLLLLAATLAALTFWLHPKAPVWSWSRPSGEGEVELSEIAQWKSPVLWVDARSAESFARQHIPQAVPLNEDAWEKLLPGLVEALHPGTRVVVYCDSQRCDASREVAARLKRELNLPNVYILKGGWTVWRQTHQ